MAKSRGGVRKPLGAGQSFRHGQRDKASQHEKELPEKHRENRRRRATEGVPAEEIVLGFGTGPFPDSFKIPIDLVRPPSDDNEAKKSAPTAKHRRTKPQKPPEPQ